MKIAFDIGGVISRYPAPMKLLMQALMDGGVDVHVLTDMCPDDAHTCLHDNGFEFIPNDNVHSADWTQHGDRCKTEVIHREGFDILIDDRPDYCAEGDFIGLVLSPRPQKPYYATEWVNHRSALTFVPTSEYEAYIAWKAQQ
jgi:hypothetical protein